MSSSLHHLCEAAHRRTHEEDQKGRSDHYKLLRQHPFQKEDFQEIEEAARKMESHYCQFFDYVMVNDRLQDSCVQLLRAVRRAQDEPQWVPVNWIRPTEVF